MTAQVTILAIGNELIQGRIADTNAAFLADQLYRAGFTVRGTMFIGDDRPRIAQTLRELALVSDAIVTSGGLGPTSDDLTRQAVADAAGCDLTLSDSALIKLSALLTSRGRTMNENNRRQVYFPAGARVLANEIGTADAFVTELDPGDGRKVPVISLPGVPRELVRLTEQHVLPELRSRLAPSCHPVERNLRIFGITESALGALVEGLMLPPEITVAYRPQFPELLVTLSMVENGPSGEGSGAVLNRAATAIRGAVGEARVFSDDVNETMEACVARLLTERDMTIAAAESCTGGLISHRLVSIPGASQFFLGAAITYANEAKQVLVGVREELLVKQGAVSKEVACQMAYGARSRLGADIGVSVTGIAGPDGGTESKPVGTFWVGFSSAQGTEAFHQFYPTGRNQFRIFCSTFALDIVRRHLLGFPKSLEIT